MSSGDCDFCDAVKAVIGGCRSWTVHILRRDMVEPCSTSDGKKERQKLPELSKQEREVVACGGEDSVNGFGPLAGEVVAAHAPLGLDMADH